MLKGSELNEAKKILASEITKLWHGLNASESAASTAQKIFEEGLLGADLPTILIDTKQLEQGLWIIEALKQAEFIKSNGEGRRLINNGRGRLNDVVVVEADRSILISDATSDAVIKLSSGKKRHALLKAN